MQGKHAEAEPLYRQAIGIQESKLGADHHNVAVTLGNLASSLKARVRVVDFPLARMPCGGMRTYLVKADGDARHRLLAQLLQNSCLLRITDIKVLLQEWYLVESMVAGIVCFALLQLIKHPSFIDTFRGVQKHEMQCQDYRSEHTFCDCFRIFQAGFTKTVGSRVRQRQRKESSTPPLRRDATQTKSSESPLPRMASGSVLSAETIRTNRTR